MNPELLARELKELEEKAVLLLMNKQASDAKEGLPIEEGYIFNDTDCIAKFKKVIENSRKLYEEMMNKEDDDTMPELSRADAPISFYNISYPGGLAHDYATRSRYGVCLTMEEPLTPQYNLERYGTQMWIEGTSTDEILEESLYTREGETCSLDIIAPGSRPVKGKNPHILLGISEPVELEDDDTMPELSGDVELEKEEYPKGKDFGKKGYWDTEDNKKDPVEFLCDSTWLLCDEQ